MNELDIEIIRDDATYLVRELQNIDKDKAIKSGLRAGGMVLKKGGMNRLRERMSKPSGITGNLLRSFTVRTKRNSLGVLIGFSQEEGRDGWYSHIVDLGSASRSYTNKNGVTHYTGAAKAMKFWTDTKNEDMPQAQGMIIKGIERYVERVNNKL